jgi:hypothetical protein
MYPCGASAREPAATDGHYYFAILREVKEGRMGGWEDAWLSKQTHLEVVPLAFVEAVQHRGWRLPADHVIGEHATVGTGAVRHLRTAQLAVGAEDGLPVAVDEDGWVVGPGGARKEGRARLPKRTRWVRGRRDAHPTAVPHRWEEHHEGPVLELDHLLRPGMQALRPRGIIHAKDDALVPPVHHVRAAETVVIRHVEALVVVLVVAGVEVDTPVVHDRRGVGRESLGKDHVVRAGARHQ